MLSDFPIRANYLYNACLLILSSSHSSDTLQYLLFIEACAKRTCDFVSLKECPPSLPLPLAAASPALVH